MISYKYSSSKIINEINRSKEIHPASERCFTILVTAFLSLLDFLGGITQCRDIAHAFYTFDLDYNTM
jgi:hypothetical protein